MNKILLCGLLLCMLGAGGKGYGQEVKPGTVLWEFVTGGDLWSSPAIGADGTVYVGSYDKKVYALDDKTGDKQWEFVTGHEVRSSPAIGADGTVYVGSMDNKVYALDGKTGAKQWEFETGHYVDSSPAIGADGTVYVGSWDHKVYALDGKTGAKLWDFETGGDVRSSPAIGTDGTVYVGSDDNKVYALNLDGTKKWEFQTGGDVRHSAAIGADGTVYIGSMDNKVYALDGKTGAKLWDFETGGAVLNSSPAIGADGTVYIGADDRKVYALNDKTGAKQWEFETGYWVRSSPAVGSDGTIYIGSFDKKVYALKSSSAGPADTPWPMFGQNAQGTGVAPGGKIKIISQTGSTSLVKGSTIIFKFKADGSFPRTYQWERNGKAIAGATQPTLTIENATSKDSGLYRVTITNKYGSVTSDEAVLKVVSPGASQIFANGKEVVGSVVKGDKAEITLSTSFERGAIFYTLDGGEPSFESMLYDEPFTVSKTTGIRAIAYKEDFSDLAESDPVFINIVPNYNLNVSIEGQGSIIKDPADGSYMQDSVVQLKAVSKEGWRFAGWDGDLKSSFEEGSVVMAKTKSVKALFEEIPKYFLGDMTKGGGVILRSESGVMPEPEHEGFTVLVNGKEAGAQVKVLGNALVELKIGKGSDWLIYYTLDGSRPLFSSTRVLYTIPFEVAVGAMIKMSAHAPDINDAELIIPGNHTKIVKGSTVEILGAASQANFPYYQGTEVVLNAQPAEGWEFMGWSGDASGTNQEISITMDHNKDVIAIFGTDLLTIATGKGKLILDPPEGPYAHGSKVKINPAPDAGYYLGVWGGDALGMEKGPIEYEITQANPKITALFVPLKENRFTVTTLASSGGSVVSNPNSNAYVNGQQVTLTATPDPGYSFVGWTGDIESTVNPLITLADANKTVTAEFRRNIFAPVTLTIDAVNGQVTRNPADELYEKGTSVELLAQPNAGYTFTGWVGDLEGTASRATLFLDGDKIVTANFKASYQLATETRGPGSVLTTPSSTTFIDGDEVILTASPGEGYGFVGWTGDLESTDQQTTLVMDSNKRVIAHFAQLGTLTTWSRGEGTITRSPDKESYFPGAKVTLTATAGDGFQFVNWDGQASGTKNPTTVTMDRAMSVAANFKDIQAPTVSIASPSSQETGKEVFVLSGSVQDNGKIKTLSWILKGQQQGELELVDGKFELKDQKLAGGPNEITVIATDWGGNEGKGSTTPVWNPQRTLRMSQVAEKQEGKRIEVELNMDSPGEVAGMFFKIGYDKAFLSDPIVTWSSAVGLAIPLVNTGVEGEIRGTFSLPANALPAGQQLICTMSFRARSVPETLETFLDMEQLTITNPKGIILSSGTEVISEPVRILVRKFDGDNNANNKLDVGDATRIQRLLVGLETARLWDVFGNDTNGNDELDPGDVTKVLRTVVAIDPQPKAGGNRDIQKMGGGDDSPEKALIKVTEKTADSVTVQIVLKDMISQISGASFELKYPVEMLRLQGKDSHRRGEMASKAARYMWNVEPSQNDYTTQDGTIAMAAISSEQWSIKEGVLAELTFEVQDGADLNKAVLSLNEVEVSPDGFDNRMLDGVELHVGSGATIEPEPSIIEILAITRSPFAFSFGAKEGRVYDVQSSEDLRSWGTLKSYNGTGTLIRFEDERDQVFPQIYYRVKVVE